LLNTRAELVDLQRLIKEFSGIVSAFHKFK